MTSEFEQILNYKFNNVELLKNALTHSSFANEVHSHGGSNERLEFLGDSVLSIIVSDYIYKNFPNLPFLITIFLPQSSQTTSVSSSGTFKCSPSISFSAFESSNEKDL